MRAFRRATSPDLAVFSAIQEAAFAPNRAILGVEPLPLLVDHAGTLAGKDVWLLEENGEALGAMAVEREGDALLVWSLATAPSAQRRGVGAAFLAHAESLAVAAGLARLTLCTGEKLVSNVDWYRRKGFSIDRIETLDDRRLVHMSRPV